MVNTSFYPIDTILTQTFCSQSRKSHESSHFTGYEYESMVTGEGSLSRPHTATVSDEKNDQLGSRQPWLSRVD